MIRARPCARRRAHTARPWRRRRTCGRERSLAPPHPSRTAPARRSAGDRREINGRSTGDRRAIDGRSAGDRREIDGRSTGDRREINGRSAGDRREIGVPAIRSLAPSSRAAGRRRSRDCRGSRCSRRLRRRRQAPPARPRVTGTVMASTCHRDGHGGMGWRRWRGFVVVMAGRAMEKP